MRIVLGALLALTAGGASAADLEQLPVPAGYNWSGIYAGVHAGFGWQDTDGIFDQGGVPGGPYDLSDFDVRGFVGGVHLGANKQWNRLVVGVEGDVSFSEADDTLQGAAPPAGSTVEIEANLNLLASVRGRVGVAFDNILLYGTGGIGYAESSLKSTFTNIGLDPERDSAFSHDWGPVFGAGLEYGKGNFVFRLEGIHYDVDSTFTFAAAEIPDADATDFIDWQGVTVIRAGLSYKIPVFGP